MKKTAFVTILSATLLFTSCSSGKTTATSAATEATTAATTEATTTEETTTVTETTAEPDMPEDYANVSYINMDKSDTPIATDFDFVDSEFYKDDNGVLKYPNYQAGKDIVIKFKSDKALKYGEITRHSPINNYLPIRVAYADKSTKDSKNSILKILKCTEGEYTLKIPAKYAINDSEICIRLFTTYPAIKNGNVLGYGMNLFVRCDKETKTPVPEFTPENHSNMNNQVDAKDFDFGNAELVVTHDKHNYKTELPKFKANSDIKITFKCEKELFLSNLTVKEPTNDFNDITDPGFLKSDNGTYTLTIPAEQAKDGREFNIYIRASGANAKSLWFMISC